LSDTLALYSTVNPRIERQRTQTRITVAGFRAETQRGFSGCSWDELVRLFSVSVIVKIVLRPMIAVSPGITGYAGKKEKNPRPAGPRPALSSR
jgi:hypothetical protein